MGDLLHNSLSLARASAESANCAVTANSFWQSQDKMDETCDWCAGRASSLPSPDASKLPKSDSIHPYSSRLDGHFLQGSWRFSGFD
jgi:hypothetical protein